MTGTANKVKIQEGHPATKLACYESLTERPDASAFGVGVCQIGTTLYASDRVSWFVSAQDALFFAAHTLAATTLTHTMQRSGFAAVLTGVVATAPTTGGTIELRKNGTAFATLTWADGATVPTYSGAFFTNNAGLTYAEGDIIDAVIANTFVVGTKLKIKLGN